MAQGSRQCWCFGKRACVLRCACGVFLSLTTIWQPSNSPLFPLRLPLAFPWLLLQEMDVEGEMARGLLPGAIALSSKFVPALKKVTTQTVESAKSFLQEGPAAAAAAAAGGSSGNGGGEGRGSGEGAALRRGGRQAGEEAGVRNRRREVELSGVSSSGATTTRFGGEAAVASRKDN